MPQGEKPGKTVDQVEGQGEDDVNAAEVEDPQGKGTKKPVGEDDKGNGQDAAAGVQNPLCFFIKDHGAALP
jgi:hypothetical protein